MGASTKKRPKFVQGPNGNSNPSTPPTTTTTTTTTTTSSSITPGDNPKNRNAQSSALRTSPRKPAGSRTQSSAASEPSTPSTRNINTFSTNNNIADDPDLVVDNRDVDVGLTEEEEVESDDEVDVDDMPVENDSTYSVAMAALIDALCKAMTGQLGNSKAKAKKGQMEVWLREYLDMNGWWVRACAAGYITKKLGIELHDVAYYMDIYIWLPDVRFNEFPSCPTCGLNHCVERDGLDKETPARRVIACPRDYYVVGIKLRCTECQKKHKLLKARREKTKGVRATDSLHYFSAKPSVEGVEEYTEAPKQEVVDLCDDDMSVDESDSEEEEENFHQGTELQKSDIAVRYRFRTWTLDSLKLSNYQTHFPAFLTKRSGIDRTLLRTVVATFSSGMRGAQFANMITELQSSHHAEMGLQHERELKQPKIDAALKGSTSTEEHKHELFSTFLDPNKYNGKIRCAKYIRSVYKQFCACIRPHCDKAVKMRSGTTLSYDASYKVSKLLARLHGVAMYACLQTATTNFNEIRIQNLTVTDGHEQMTTPFGAMIATQKMYNQETIRHVTTDNPTVDRNYFNRVFRAVSERQERFNSNKKTDPFDLPPPQYASSKVRVVSTRQGITDACEEILQKAKDTIGLDSEWVWNHKTGPEKTSLLQFSYYDGDDRDDARINTVLFRLGAKWGTKSTLPSKLIQVLTRQKLTGRAVGVDVAKIERDFNYRHLVKNSTRVELGKMAKDRGVVQSGSASLQVLAKLVLGEHLEKGMQSSHWSADEDLTPEQIKYAALDAMVSLRICTKLSKMVDINWRMKVRSEATVGRLVDVATSLKGDMFGRIATGEVVDDNDENQALQPKGYKVKRAVPGVREKRVLVKITAVYANACIIKTYAKNKAEKSHQVTLGELGGGEFTLYIPFSQLGNPLPQSLHPKSNDDSSDDEVEQILPPNNDNNNNDDDEDNDGI